MTTMNTVYHPSAQDVSPSGQVPRRRVYFSDSGVTLQQGQPLCYDEDASTKVALSVICPESSKGYNFAGIVTEDSAGKVGPCWIDIYMPQRGDVLDVLVYKPSSSGANVAVGDILIVSPSSATATSGHGYFSAWTMATIASTAAAGFGTAAIASIKSLLQDHGVLAWESVAKQTGDVAAARVLVRVKFL